MKKFKAESQKLLDMMINSVYTHKEIFLRELISNAADAIDKQYYQSLNGGQTGVDRSEYKIELTVDKDNRILTVSDNGCGMDAESMEKNLGTIAHSGTDDFRATAEGEAVADVIGRFGVGFYSAFMVAQRVQVLSKPYGSDKAYLWESCGVDGFTISEAQKDSYGTDVILTVKDNTQDENYSEFLDVYRLKSLIKKHSDYIRYPIIMEFTRKQPTEENETAVEVTEKETVNSMVPLWKKSKSELTDEDANSFYYDKFHDFDNPLLRISVSVEGAVSFNALLFVPSHAPYDYYSKEYEKGLQLYSNGVLIMDKCPDLLPDHFSFVKGVVDSADLSLNLSREMLQHNRQLKVIAAAIEKRLRSELADLLENKPEDYDKFFKAFGVQLKYGIYSTFGANKDDLVPLLVFGSVESKKAITLKQYAADMKEGQKYIYYASGSSIDSVAAMPQIELIREKGYDILALTDNVDEFLMKILEKYDGKEFKSVADEDLGIEANEKELTDIEKGMLEFVKKALDGKIKDVKVSKRLKTHPVCLTSEGAVSIEMEKVLSSIPNSDNISAQKVLEINAEHPIYGKMEQLFESDKDKLTTLAAVLYNQARLIEGLPIDNPAKYSEDVCSLLS